VGVLRDETVVYRSDEQVPFHDKRSVRLVERYIADVQPDIVVFGGDLNDFTGLTTKFLRRREDKGNVAREIRQSRRLIMNVREAAPNARIVVMAGNHEERLVNYIRERADELEGLEELRWDRLLDLPDVEFVPSYGDVFEYRGFIFKHGEAVVKYAASKELVNEGNSGMSGHTHRAQSYAHTDRSGEHKWWSVGCLCNIKGPHQPPGFRKGSSVLQNWQQGFGVVRFAGRRFSAYSVVITGHQFISPEGRLYRG
jgi:hypothetical protein